MVTNRAKNTKNTKICQEYDLSGMTGNGLLTALADIIRISRFVLTNVPTNDKGSLIGRSLRNILMEIVLIGPIRFPVFPTLNCHHLRAVSRRR